MDIKSFIDKLNMIESKSLKIGFYKWNPVIKMNEFIPYTKIVKVTTYNPNTWNESYHYIVE